jgi:hypothetical protein
MCVADSLLDEWYDRNTTRATPKQETAACSEDMFLELHTRIKDLPVFSSQGSAFAKMKFTLFCCTQDAVISWDWTCISAPLKKIPL